MKLKMVSENNGTAKVVEFHCPGCDEVHHVWVNGSEHPNGSCWGFNNDFSQPTFSPSILIRSGHYAPHFNKEKDSCWCTYNREHPEEPVSFECGICHSFVNNGKIQFLTDCTHKLAGQTVDLPEIV